MRAQLGLRNFAPQLPATDNSANAWFAERRSVFLYARYRYLQFGRFLFFLCFALFSFSFSFFFFFFLSIIRSNTMNSLFDNQNAPFSTPTFVLCSLINDFTREEQETLVAKLIYKLSRMFVRSFVRSFYFILFLSLLSFCLFFFFYLRRIQSKKDFTTVEEIHSF